ncbi:MAG: outer membrane beta-barrel protein [Thiothrix sp.]|uniref:outer membrane beta-barrel protein n=1 Tax=Thiothrix sp. TaxID=1032 RepID=UPI002614AADC|nr:outer membrane beta-barrel protein [Thiothrix sp.]MDD5394571.1 outer membrane beta-barrel protein [Thiothrix sp.]
MKKIGFLVLLLPQANITYADNYTTAPSGFMNGTKLYVGGSVGVSQQGDTCNDPFFEGSCDNKDTAVKVFGGARFDPMWGAEVAYNKLGKTSKNGTIGSTPASINNTLSGISASGVGYLPVAPQIEAFGKAGAMFWNRETSQTAGGTSTSSKADGTSPLLGAGAQYQLNDNLHLRGEWEHMFNVGSDSAYETDADQYSVGLLYSTL